MQSTIAPAQFTSLNTQNKKEQKPNCINSNISRFSGNFSNGYLNQTNLDKYMKSDTKIYCRPLLFSSSQSSSTNYSDLARSYKDAGNYRDAIAVYNKILIKSPNDRETLTLIGQCYKDSGDVQAKRNNIQSAKKYYQTARQYYISCVKDDPKYDYAMRALKEDNYAELALTNPKKAQELETKRSQENLQKAFQLAEANTPKDLAQTLNNLNSISFDKTNSLSNHKNIAQYEPQDNSIIVSDEYALAAPEVLAPYLAHEAVHAEDQDGLTSIREEQDGYRAGVKCWQKVNNGIEDPELDYINKLYKEDPQKLDDKVRQTYKERDSTIPDVSPHHGMDGNAAYIEDNGSIYSFLYCRFLQNPNAAILKPDDNDKNKLVSIKNTSNKPKQLDRSG